jgi:hypothetical protein
LFGQAGFLNIDPEDEYSFRLKSEYEFLKNKHNLVTMDNSLWKYAKLRPGNFPSIRIAQVAALLSKYQSLWEVFITLEDIKDIYSVFDITASEYWDNHYVFGKISPNIVSKRLGKTAVDSLIINVLSSMIFTYSIYRGDETLRERAIYFLEVLAAESNSIVNEWIECGIKPNNALESQALLHLQSEYCANKRCLKCAIGNEVIEILI